MLLCKEVCVAKGPKRFLSRYPHNEQFLNWFGAYVFVISPSYFILNKRTGFLIIKENAPPGTYQFQVRVSDGVWPDAVSTVTVHVRELRDEAIYNSGSLRLAGEIDTTQTDTQRETYKHCPKVVGHVMSSPVLNIIRECNIFL